MTEKPECGNCWNMPICKAYVEINRELQTIEDRYNAGQFSDGTLRSILFDRNPAICAYFRSRRRGQGVSE